MANHVKDMTGRKISKLTVLKRADRRANTAYWQCRCECGKVIEVSGTELRRKGREGDAKSCGCHRRNPEAEIVRAYSQYQASAVLRCLDFDITYEEFRGLVQSDCVYCGAAPEIREIKHGKRFKVRVALNGIDRIDPDGSYRTGNVAPACSACNQMKFDLTRKEFLEQCVRIVKFCS